MENRVILETNERGMPILPVIDLGHAYSGSINAADLKAVIALTNFSNKKFWERYLSKYCGFSTFRGWLYGTATPPQFLLVHLTATHEELYSLFSQVLK